MLDRVPDLQLLLAHAGGTLPFVAGRLDSCYEHDLEIRGRLKQKPSEYLRTNCFLDGVIYGGKQIDLAESLVGADRIMYGTDNPFFPSMDGGDVWESAADNIDAAAAAAADTDGLLFQNANVALKLGL